MKNIFNKTSIKRVYAILLRQMILLYQSPRRLIQTLYWSAIELLVWAVITRYFHSVGGEKFDFVTVIIGTLIMWNFFTRLMNGVTLAFLEDVWSRNLINLFASPLTIAEYASGLMLVGVLNTFAAVCFMASLAWFLMAYNIFQFGFDLLPFIFILFLSGWSMGIFATAAVMRYGPSVEFIVWALPSLIMPFASIFYPVSALPGIFQPVAYLIPVSYVFTGMRGIVNNGSFDATALIFGAVLAFLYLVVSMFVLFRVYGSVLKLGLFSRFMTE